MNSQKSRLPIALAAALLSANAYAAPPIIPGAAGFGMDTPAGRGGKIFRVTNLQASGSGSLEACVAASGPRICIFEVSGVIRLTSALKIRNPYITIAGQTAPAPGIMIRGAGLGIHASDVLVQHLSVRPGDNADGPDPQSRDALSISLSDPMTGRNVVVDHCSFSWSIDEIAEVWGTWSDVTLSNNIFSEPLHDSLHPKGSHGFAALSGPKTRRISFSGNLFAHALDRNPLTRAEEFVFVNNVVYDMGYTATDLQSEGDVSLNSIVGNHFIKGPSSSSKANSIILRGGEFALVSGSKVYVQDNVGDRPDGTQGTSDPWSIVDNESGLSRTALESASPPAWPVGMVARTTTNNEVLKNVLANAGSRPGERSAVDARIVGEVENRTGRIINCVEDDGRPACAVNAGGWPTYSQNHRALTLPTNPHGDDDGNGYTNIEEWLHQYSTEVEGGASGPRPSPPTVQVH